MLERRCAMKFNDITIKVNRFGPLEKVSFKISPMMIFTGQSSLGKSYANYLVYYFMSSVCNGKLYDIINDDEICEEPKRYTFDIDAFFADLSAHAEDFMRRFLGDDKLQCDVEFKSIKRNRTIFVDVRKLNSRHYHGTSAQEDSLLHTPQAYELCVRGGLRRSVPSINYLRFYVGREFQNFILGEYIGRAVILPPGRGAFVGENFSIKSEISSSMNMYNMFFRDYDNGLSSRIHFPKDDHNYLSGRLLNMTSGGDLLSVEGKQYLQLDNDHRIALSASASSIKDMAPWLFYLKNFSIIPCSYCMEEPEAHQHPSMTVQIADVMAIAMHQLGASMYHLTTHSDYLIQRFNQLIKLGSIRRKDVSFFQKICEERGLDQLSYLDAKDIQAYYFKRGHNGKTIVENLEVTDDGIPMRSFFDVVRDLENREEYIADAIYRLEKGQI